MKKIKLGRKNIYALVDDEDYELVTQYNWHLCQGYARREISRGKFELMHRLINNTPEGMITDHINRDKLDNQKINLRTTTYTQNVINTDLKSNNTSGYRGIDFYKRVGKWRVRLSVNNKNMSFGYYSDLEDAIEARKEAEKEHWKKLL